ncbi:hypothetical protein AB0C95_10490 [Streptomyces caniferus]|uniref:hypothetical protein n=1 Tax=Streptomyces caniferus TaxID=285557 RepID=UPI0033F37777
MADRSSRWLLPPPRGNGVLVEGPQPGRRLAGVEHCDTQVGDQIDVPPRHRGYAT